MREPSDDWTREEQDAYTMEHDRRASLPAWQRGISLADLLDKEFPPIRYVVDGYIVEGLTVLAGAPKARKSWMMLDAAVAVATGDKAFGTILCEHGDVLFLGLEDNQRRLKDRLDKMSVIQRNHHLMICTQWAAGDEAVEAIEAWARGVEKPTLVVVDVLARVREFTGREASYEADYRALVALHDLASRLAIAVVVIHHTRKAGADDPFDEVSGTRGLTGAADTVLVIRRDNTGGASFRATLYGRGRDIPEIETAIEFDDETYRWKVLGEAWKVADTAERQEVLDVLRDAGRALRVKDIAEELGKTAANISKMLRAMLKAGLVMQPSYGCYTPVEVVETVEVESDSSTTSTTSTTSTDPKQARRSCPACAGGGCLKCGHKGYVRGCEP